MNSKKYNKLYSFAIKVGNSISELVLSGLHCSTEMFAKKLKISFHIKININKHI